MIDLMNSTLLEDIDPETGSYDEDLRPRNVPNPKLQRICEAMKHRALHPGEELPQFESQILKQLLEPRSQYFARQVATEERILN
uniref:Uncharacterized protein n=1 Tax=Parascaris equorum TaxID=6256 RepID=A0A914SAQ5_PAREQ